MIAIDQGKTPSDLAHKLDVFWTLSAEKIQAVSHHYDHARGAPVFTVEGRYTSRGWTDWTEGFEHGSAILQFDATGDGRYLDIGRTATLQRMASHLTHTGVHDHGFNNVSTYGNLWRLMHEGRITEDPWEKRFYELALKCSGAVQASRWTALQHDGGYIYSFNGPHSLFADTIRSLRSLALAHLLGHALMTENGRRISLLQRLITHARTTARYNVYYGHGRDAYDVRGRVAHESIFNVVDGSFRCSNSQQGYSPFTTWTRGLSWIMLGFAEQLEFLHACAGDVMSDTRDGRETHAFMLEAAKASCDYYLACTPRDGVPYWDTGAPGLADMGDYLDRPADPFNAHEPVDSSAGAIAAQGLLRLGHYLQETGDPDNGRRYFQAGLTVLDTLLEEPYLNTDKDHHGLLLHSLYHRPNAWDHRPTSHKVPCGESSMWGDYHIREAALYLLRIHQGAPYLCFFGGAPGRASS